MRVLMVSKAFVSAAYRRKLVELARLGIDVVGVVPPSWREGGSEQVLEPGIGAERLQVSPMRLNGHFHLHWYPCLPRLLDELRPDLLHVDEEPYNLATYHAVRAAHRRGIPSLFFTWQNLHRTYPPPFPQLERAVYRRCPYAVAGSDDAAAVLRAKGYGGRVVVIPQFGVDPDEFAPGPAAEGPFRVGFFNRLVPGKDPLLMLRAFGRLPVEARLVVVGDGPLRETVQRAAASFGDRVTLLSRVPSAAMPDLMRSVHAVVLPSRTTPSWKEQFGRVLVEAMASGVPVVGSDSGEIPRVIGDAGFVVPEGDETALAAALTRLADDTLRADLGRRGRERVLEHFTHARVAEQTVSVYQDILAGRPI